MININSQKWPPQSDEVSFETDKLDTVLQSAGTIDKLQRLGNLCGHLFNGPGILPLHKDAILSVLEGQISRATNDAPRTTLSDEDARNTFAHAYINAQSK